MVDPVKTLAGLLIGGLFGLAQAAALPDPTRPPPGFQAGADETGKAAEAPLQVNAVYLTGAKPYALVNGMAVRTGDTLGEARVTRIDESGVWLKGPAGPRLLRLLPDVEKTPSRPATVKESPGKGRK